MKTKPYIAGLRNCSPLSVGARDRLAPAVERGIHAASSCDVVSRWKNPETVGTREVKRHECRAPFVQVVCHIILGISIVLINALPACAATTNDLAAMLRNGLFEEQVNHDMNAAIATYQSLVTQFDKDRLLTATAVFRLGECYRTLGKTNEAAAQYQRVIREFPDQTTLVTLSRQNLGALGSNPQPALAASNDSANATVLAAAKAEAASLKAQIERLEQMSPEDLRVFVQQKYPDPVLSKLMQQLNEAEQNVTKMRKDYETNNPNFLNALEIVRTINKQVDAQVRGALNGLGIQLAIAQDTVKNLSATSTVSNPAKEHLRRSLEEQIKLTLQELDKLRSQSDPPDFELLTRQIKVEAWRKQLAALEDNTDIKSGSDEEDQEIRRIQTMIQNSPDLINAPSSDGSTPLVKAASSGWLKVAAYLLDHGADVKVGAPLNAAAAAGNRAMVELLLNRGADVNSKNKQGETPLEVAVRRKYQSVVEVLLVNKADVNVQDDSGVTPLLLASQRDNPKIVAMLLEQKAATDPQSQYGLTPLTVAAAAGQLENVRLLLAAGANPNVDNYNGRTPLSYAAEKGSPEMVKNLLAAKANANGDAKNNDGRTPLSYAAERGSPEIMKLLLEAKADPNAGRLNAPLFCAIYKHDILTAESLLKAGANPNTVGNFDFPTESVFRPGVSPQSGGGRGGRSGGGGSGSLRLATPLWFAIFENQFPMVQLLLKFKADPNDSQTDGKPLLFSALSKTNILEALLDAGARVDAMGAGTYPNDGNLVSPLGEAVWQNNPTAVEILLKKGANPNAHYPPGNWTPLKCAALVLADRKVFELLLAYKADPNVQVDSGQTPLAILNDKTKPDNRTTSSPQQKAFAGELADLLRKHGALDNLPMFDRIQVTRPDTSYRAAAFYSGTNGWNQFTLLEVLAQQWGLLNTKRSGGWTRLGAPEYWSLNNGNPIRFPNLARVKIHRPGKDNGTMTTLSEDLTILDAKTGGMRVIPLQMGDVVEVPEADHPVNETWKGFVQPDYLALSNSIARTVTLRVGGASTNLTLTPVIFAEGSATRLIAPSFMIRSVLDESKLIRSSSDLTRVKVTRRESANAKPVVWVVDCSNPDKSPDLWLRNGDVIEVPEK